MTLAHAFLVVSYHQDLVFVCAALALGVFPIGLALTPRVRELAARRWIARGLRGLDMVLMSLVLTIVLGELALRAWRQVAPSPLFATVDMLTEERVRANAFKPGSLRMGFTANSGGHYDTER